jgi:prepilin-type processing-associated H-X9-DG protein
LIELLVVIAIISMLISILTPSLARARQQARATVCMASLNEIMRATIAYTHDYEYHMPPTSYPALPKPPEAPRVMTHGWAEALHAYLFLEYDFSFAHDFPVMRNVRGEHELFVCKEAEPFESNSGHYRVYPLTWGTGNLDTFKYELPLIMDANPDVPPPPGYPVSCCEPDHDLIIDYCRADIPLPHIAGLEDEAYVDERHYGGANYAFRDGHVERSTKLKEQLAEDWDLDPDTENR